MEGTAKSGDTFECSSVNVLDGDTFDCGSTRVRLQGIDAPELEGHCRPGRECAPGDPVASTDNLRRLATRNSVQCRKADTDAYGRTVARCTAGETDLSCAQIQAGYAIRRYALIMC
ncbi:MAG: nuclease [Novosphingobium sp.]|nr:nuclease [Novosphingobium sp.]